MSVMRTFLSLLLIIILFHHLGCKSTDSSSKSESTPGTDTPQHPSSPSVQPTALKPNSSTITATVDSIMILDDVQYRLAIHTTSVEPVGDLASLAEAGQNLVVMPSFVSTDDGKADLTNDRNKKLLAVRSAKKGDVIRGRVSLNRDGKWFLTEIIGSE